MIIIVQIGWYKGEIIVRANKNKFEDKDEDVKTGNRIGDKDRDNIG